MREECYADGWVFETYTKFPAYDYLKDNNAVPVTGHNFKTWMPIQEVGLIKQMGGLSGMDKVIFTEKEDRPIPQMLKEGLMGVADVFVTMYEGKEHTL